ncbi:MAG: toprim domain-containing protein [Candidatus Micrarchaeota archaeon]
MARKIKNGGGAKAVNNMDVLEKLGKIEKLINQLNDGNFVLVVEGKRDLVALRNLGLTTEIIAAVGRSEMLVAKIVNTEKKPVILFDFDETGIERCKRLAELLENEGVVPDVAVRNKFRGLLGIRFFEESDSKFDKLKTEIEEKRR